MRNITWFSIRNHCLLTLRIFMIINHTSVKIIFSFQQNGSFDTFNVNKSCRESQTSNIYSVAEIFQVAFYGLHGTNWNKCAISDLLILFHKWHSRVALYDYWSLAIETAAIFTSIPRIIRFPLYAVAPCYALCVVKCMKFLFQYQRI